MWRNVKRWYTAHVFQSVAERVELTLDYLEKVSERKDVEISMLQDIEQLERWVYESHIRMEVVSEYKERYQTIKENRHAASE